MGSELYVQYGCGMCAPDGWRNFDCSPTLRFERIPIIGKLYTKNKSRFPKNVEFGDILTGLPVAHESCNAVYCSHVLEHLSLEDCRRALKNTFIILKNGGIFRLVMPDLEYFIQQYITNTGHDAAINFLKETLLGQEKRIKNIKELIRLCFGNSNHLWMWDYKSIEHELKCIGFKDIRRAYYGDSIEPMFSLVEDKNRWDNCLGVECKKY